VAGPAVYVLDSKNFVDRTIRVKGSSLRVTAIDDFDETYVIDRFPVVAQALELERAAKLELGFGVAVYPVVVVWGRFEAQEAWIGEVAVVHGKRIVDWLEERPADLLRADKRQIVADWAASLPTA
jgi:hypothetical protein